MPGTGRRLTSASAYIKVWVSAVYMFIDHDLLTVILRIYAVVYKLLRLITVTHRHVRFTIE